MLKIGILLGDDIGLEVVPECVKVMKAAAAKTGLEVRMAAAADRAQAAMRAARPHHAASHGRRAGKHSTAGCMGPIGHNAYPRNDPTWIMPPLRKKFELFANIKPVKSYPNIQSVHKDVDIVFLREVTEGMQSSEHRGRRQRRVPPQRRDLDRHARGHAQGRQPRCARGLRDRAHAQAQDGDCACTRSRSTAWCAACSPRSAARWRRNIPDCKFEEVLVDGFAMKLVMKPQQFDVVVTTNQFGDILTDEGAGLVGGLGLAPGLVRRRAPGDGAGDPRLGARHRRQEHRQPLRHDHVGQDAVRMAGPQAQRAEGDEGGAADRQGGGQGHRRSANT